MTDKQNEALKLAREALETLMLERGSIYDKAIRAIREAQTEQPAQQGVDWEKLYRLEVKKKEALAVKYERDTGKKLTRIVPMAEQPAQQQEPVAIHQFRKRGCADWYDGHPDHTDGGGPYEVRTVYTTPPTSKPWVGLTQSEMFNMPFAHHWLTSTTLRDAYKLGALDAEAKLREKNA